MPHRKRILVAIPVYNEEKHVESVLSKVLRYAEHVLVIDDGSKDRTPQLLDKFPVDVIRHYRNRGYGRSLTDAFYWSREGSSTSDGGFDWLVTMDCDEQHEPESIPDFVAEALRDEHDVVSGSRYMEKMSCGAVCTPPPPERRAINAEITSELNKRLNLRLTDAFCGFKAYRVKALEKLRLTEPGYAFPMQFWVQAVAAGLRIVEIPVRLIYNDLNRTFGGPLNDPAIRIAHYRKVLHTELCRCADRLPASAVADLDACLSGCR